MSIQRLAPETIRRIAAGEVVQQPSSALKELIENSIDAHSTSIKIQLKKGGMSMLQISDNGSGVHLLDFPILCHRFTTSKIAHYSDIASLHSFGFRGEALSSISLVSKLTVISRKSDQPLAYKADYLNGELVGSPEPIAYNQGTKLIINDLFYNNPGRKKALSNTTQLALACYEVSVKYALHYRYVSFNYSDDNSDFSSDGSGSLSECLKLLVKKNEEKFIEIKEVKTETCVFSGVMSGWEFDFSKKELILFINGRLVQSGRLNKLIEQIYSKYIFKKLAYLVYLSIDVEPSAIDVNVHPCKEQVILMKETEVFCEIEKCLSMLLEADISVNSKSLKNFEISIEAPKKTFFKPAPKSQIRVDSDVKLEWSFNPVAPIEQKNCEEDLISISELKSEIFTSEIQEILDSFLFIGCIDKTYSVIQCKTSLYSINVQNLLFCAIYQSILDNFGKFAFFRIEDSDLGIKEVVRIGCKNLKLYDPSTDLGVDFIAEKIEEIISNHSEMLRDYFSIHFCKGKLTELPILLDGLVQPDVSQLPEFILRLGTEVKWKNEKECLEKVSFLIAWFYSVVPDNWQVGDKTSDFEYHYKYNLFPYLKGKVKADQRYISSEKGIHNIVSTQNLYSIFERC